MIDAKQDCFRCYILPCTIFHYLTTSKCIYLPHFCAQTWLCNTLSKPRAMRKSVFRLRMSLMCIGDMGHIKMLHWYNILVCTIFCTFMGTHLHFCMILSAICMPSQTDFVQEISSSYSGIPDDDIVLVQFHWGCVKLGSHQNATPLVWRVITWIWAYRLVDPRESIWRLDDTRTWEAMECSIAPIHYYLPQLGSTWFDLRNSFPSHYSRKWR